MNFFFRAKKQYLFTQKITKIHQHFCHKYIIRQLLIYMVSKFRIYKTHNFLDKCISNFFVLCKQVLLFCEDKNFNSFSCIYTINIFLTALLLLTRLSTLMCLSSFVSHCTPATNIFRKEKNLSRKFGSNIFFLQMFWLCLIACALF